MSAPPPKRLLAIAFESACAACGVTADEAGRTTDNGNLRRGAACVTARMVYTLLTSVRFPMSRTKDLIGAPAVPLGLDTFYQARSRAETKLSRNELVEINPPPLTATEEKVWAPMGQVLRSAVAEYDRRVTASQATSSTRRTA